MGLWFEQLEKLQCHLLRPGRLGKSRSVEGDTKISDLTMTAVRCQSETKVDVLSEQSDVCYLEFMSGIPGQIGTTV